MAVHSQMGKDTELRCISKLPTYLMLELSFQWLIMMSTRK
uniref:Uncharacterized protein n=1 Tax=Rhizophora mucronata TaxID=61149 RepID=A0A2P2PAA7_RHIMU